MWISILPSRKAPSRTSLCTPWRTSEWGTWCTCPCSRTCSSPRCGGRTQSPAMIHEYRVPDHYIWLHILLILDQQFLPASFPIGNAIPAKSSLAEQTLADIGTRRIKVNKTWGQTTIVTVNKVWQIFFSWHASRNLGKDFFGTYGNSWKESVTFPDLIRAWKRKFTSLHHETSTWSRLAKVEF